MDESVQAQIETQLSHLDGLIQRGRQILDRLANGASSPVVMAETRAWQEHCGATINQLSGGSKAHWLARSFSNAFLMRIADGRAAEGIAPEEIVKRLLDVLGQAVISLSGMSEAFSLAELRRHYRARQRIRLCVAGSSLFIGLSCGLLWSRLMPIADELSSNMNTTWRLRTSCGVLEAIVTDALEHKGVQALAIAGAPAGKIGDWPFETRLAVAEKAGLIRGGCARLPAIARTYREHSQADGQSGMKSELYPRAMRGEPDRC